MTPSMALRLAAVTTALSAAAGCSPVTSVYDLPGYQAQDLDAVKHIAVTAWGPGDEDALGRLVAHVGSDLVKLRRSYLVHEVVAARQCWAEACGDRQGVLALRVLTAEQPGSEPAQMAVTASLLRCADGALLWRAEAEGSTEPNDGSLRELISVYVRTHGEVAQRYAAATFALLQALVATLPEPVLTDDEILEKIELGRCPNHGRAPTTTAGADLRARERISRRLWSRIVGPSSAGAHRRNPRRTASTPAPQRGLPRVFDVTIPRRLNLTQRCGPNRRLILSRALTGTSTTPPAP